MAQPLEHAVDLDGLRYFSDGGAPAHGLPSHAYTDQAFHALEKERLFPRAWMFVGFVHELAKPGDVVPVGVAGRPIVLVSGKNGEIRAFHNVCRHRCLKLVDAPKNVGRVITCPYHTWTYGLDGELRMTPHFGGPNKHDLDGFERKENGLVPVRVAVWHDWIFVNLDGQAPDFEAYAAPLAARLEGAGLEAMKPVATLDFGEVRTNWKFLMENYIEPYHVQFVHPTTTDQPLLDHYTVIDGPCLGSGVDLRPSAGGGNGGTDTLAASSRYLTLFPNFVFGRYLPDEIGVHLDVPVAVDRTHQRRVIYHTGEGDMAPETVEKLASLWHKVHKEDHAICERLQEGRASDLAAQGGWLSPHWEDSVRRFQELVVEALQDK